MILRFRVEKSPDHFQQELGLLVEVTKPPLEWNLKKTWQFPLLLGLSILKIPEIVA